jgi:hypothetical protein
MQVKMAKPVCFLLATTNFLLLFVFFNSCKKIHETKASTVSSTDTTKHSNDTVQIDSSTIRVKLTGKLLDSLGKPLSNFFYAIKPVSNPDTIYFSSGITDSLGKINNYDLHLKTAYILIVYEFCGTPIYSKSFNTFNTDIDLGNIIVPPDSISTIVTGRVVDCNNNLLTTGNIIVEGVLFKNLLNPRRYEASIKPDGTFKLQFPICNKSDSAPVIIYASDANGTQVGNRVYFSLHYPETDIGKIEACNNSDTLQFFNYTIDSIHYSLYPPDNPDAHPETPNWTFFFGGNLLTGGTYVYFGIDGYLAVNKPGLSLIEFDIYPGYGEAETPPIVNITEDGPIGGYISGNIKLQIETLDDSHSIHDASCNFRVKRKQ